MTTKKPQTLKTPEKWIGKRITHFANWRDFDGHDGYTVDAEGRLTRAEAAPAAAQPEAVAVQHIPTAQIRAGSNDRKDFNERALQELASSIAQHGLAQPITVRPMEGGAWYEIVAGERRFRAMSQVLQWQTVPALVRALDDAEAAAIMLVENTSRVDLDPMAEAVAYQVRIERFGWTPQQIAETAGVSVERVKNRLQLLTLADDIQHYVKIGQFPLGHAQLLHELDKNRQRIALKVFNSAKAMPLSRFRDVVAQLHAEQTAEQQMDMFTLELHMVQEYGQGDGTALRGKKARTGAPTRKDLPAVKSRWDDKTGDIIDRYILDLIAAGKESEAATIGTLYNALVALNCAQVPVNSVLAKISETSETAGDTPVEKLS